MARAGGVDCLNAKFLGTEKRVGEIRTKVEFIRGHGQGGDVRVKIPLGSRYLP